MTPDIIVLLVLFYLGGACSLYITVRCELLREKGYLHLVALSFFFVIAGLLGVRLLAAWAMVGPLMVVLVVGPGCLLYVPMFALAFANLLTTVRTMALGDHRLTLRRTYDQAEAAEKRRDYTRALEIYDRALKEDPADHEAMRRKGELYLVMGRTEDALRELRMLYERLVEPEAKCTIGFRIADLLVTRKKDPRSAKDLLTSLADELAGTRFAELARARLANLRF